MKKIYITGISGTGKSTIAEELNKRGIYAIDIDSDEYKLCSWKNIETQEKAHFDYGMGEDWMDAHGWYCDIEKLKRLMGTEQNIVVVVGLATNQDEYISIFDKIFLLQCKEETFINRINTRTSNDFGKHPLEKEHILGFYKDFEKSIINKGAIPINTEDSVEIVLSNILTSSPIV